MKSRHVYDPRGLIEESYNIEGISDADARGIFFDWAMRDAGDAPIEAMKKLYDHFGQSDAHHPMSKILREGIEREGQDSKRRGRRRDIARTK